MAISIVILDLTISKSDLPRRPVRNPAVYDRKHPPHTHEAGPERRVDEGRVRVGRHLGAETERDQEADERVEDGAREDVQDQVEG